jgi:hypothetical protein
MGRLSPGVQWWKRKPDHSPSSSATVKNERSCTYTSPYLLKPMSNKAQENFAFIGDTDFNCRKIMNGKL